MSSGWRWCCGALAALAGAALLVLIFIAYQQPELLLDWANLRFCG